MPQFPDMSAQMAQSIAAARPGDWGGAGGGKGTVGGGGPIAGTQKKTTANVAIDGKAIARLFGYKSLEERQKLYEDFKTTYYAMDEEGQTNSVHSPLGQSTLEGMQKKGVSGILVTEIDGKKFFDIPKESKEAHARRAGVTSEGMVKGGFLDDYNPTPTGNAKPTTPMPGQNGMNNTPPLTVPSPTPVQTPTPTPTPTPALTPSQTYSKTERESTRKNEADYMAEGGPETDRYIANTKLLTNAKVSDLEKKRAEAEILSFESNVRVNERQKALQGLDTQVKLEQLKILTDPYSRQLDLQTKEAEIAHIKAQAFHEQEAAFALTGKLSPEQEEATKGSLKIYDKEMVNINSSWALRSGTGVALSTKFDVLNQQAGVVSDLQNSVATTRSEVAANPALGNILGRIDRTIDQVMDPKTPDAITQKGVVEGILRSVNNAWDLTAGLGEASTPTNENLLFNIVAKAYEIAPGDKNIRAMAGSSLDRIAEFRAKQAKGGVVVPPHPLEIIVEKINQAAAIPPEPKVPLGERVKGYLNKADEVYNTLAPGRKD